MSGNGERLRASSVVYTSSQENAGVSLCSNLLGKKVHQIRGGSCGLFALSDTGTYNIENGCRVTSFEATEASICKESITVVTPEGELYSWGTGDIGELGLGLSNKEVLIPKKINYNANFVSVSSGDFHSAAIDSGGLLYAWGQNFDRQLGLYKKKSSEMCKSNVFIEDAVFVPRLIPLCLSHSIRKVSCGARFTCVITNKGEVWTWGAGECGQLGTGRCTVREIPQKVNFNLENNDSDNNRKNIIICDIASGAGHVIACDVDGVIYSWGLNKRGQLGLGDCNTRHQPQMIQDIKLTSLYSEGNSSAGITKSGKLFTWGSGSYFRLMHGNDKHLLLPQEVNGVNGTRISSFSFCKTFSAALVITQISKLYPLSGPLSSFSKIQIFGCGFWDCNSIIVKFTNKSSSFLPPRSCPGKFVNSGEIICSPPKLKEIGEYEVSVSMDGSLFINDVLCCDIYRDITVVSTRPRLIDLRKTDSFSTILMVKGLGIVHENVSITKDADCLEEDIAPTPSHVDVFYDINMLVSISKPSGGEPVLRNLKVKGKLIPPVIIPDESDSEKDLDASKDIEDDIEEQDMQSKTSFLSKAVEDQIQCDLTSAMLFGDDPECQGGLVTFRAQISINGQDYSICKPDADAVICHSFSALSCMPCCLPMVSGKNAVPQEIKVVGDSFIPASKLSAGTCIEAILQANLGNEFGIREVILPVRCDSSQELFFYPPTVQQLAKGTLIVDENSKKSSKKPKKLDPETLKISFLQTSVRFQLSITSHQDDKSKNKKGKKPEPFRDLSGSVVTSDSVSKTSDVVSIVDIPPETIAEPLGANLLPLSFYKPQAITISPTLLRLSSTDVKLTVRGPNGGSLPFLANDAILSFYRNDRKIQFNSNDFSISEIDTNDFEGTLICPLMELENIKELSAAQSLLNAKKEAEAKAKVKAAEELSSNDGLTITELTETMTELSVTESKEVTKDEQNDEVLEGEVEQQENQEEDKVEEEDMEELDHIFISLLLDGITPVSDKYSCKIDFFKGLKVKDIATSLPKGGFVSGSSVGVNVDGLVQSSKCVVRIKGTEEEYIEISGNNNHSAGTVTFSVPSTDQLADLSPVMQKKDKFYFVEISIDDGVSFDISENAILQIK